MSLGLIRLPGNFLSAPGTPPWPCFGLRVAEKKMENLTMDFDRSMESCVHGGHGNTVRTTQYCLVPVRGTFIQKRLTRGFSNLIRIWKKESSSVCFVSFCTVVGAYKVTS